LYAALALRNGQTLPGNGTASVPYDAAQARRAVQLLTAGAKDSPLAPLRAIATALLTDVRDPAAFVAAVPEESLQGPDRVVLHALAARRLGGPAWQRCRATLADVNGRQPLDGAALLVVNRLARAPLPAVQG
jgi:hypothetical protein